MCQSDSESSLLAVVSSLESHGQAGQLHPHLPDSSGQAELRAAASSQSVPQGLATADPSRATLGRARHR